MLRRRQALAGAVPNPAPQPPPPVQYGAMPPRLPPIAPQPETTPPRPIKTSPPHRPAPPPLRAAPFLPSSPAPDLQQLPRLVRTPHRAAMHNARSLTTRPPSPRQHDDHPPRPASAPMQPIRTLRARRSAPLQPIRTRSEWTPRHGKRRRKIAKLQNCTSIFSILTHEEAHATPKGNAHEKGACPAEGTRAAFNYWRHCAESQRNGRDQYSSFVWRTYD